MMVEGAPTTESLVVCTSCSAREAWDGVTDGCDSDERRVDRRRVSPEDITRAPRAGATLYRHLQPETHSFVGD